MRPTNIPAEKRMKQQTVTRDDIFVHLLLNVSYILSHLTHIVYEVYTTVDPVYIGEDIDM